MVGGVGDADTEGAGTVGADCGAAHFLTSASTELVTTGLGLLVVAAGMRAVFVAFPMKLVRKLRALPLNGVAL